MNEGLKQTTFAAPEEISGTDVAGWMRVTVIAALGDVFASLTVEKWLECKDVVSVDIRFCMRLIKDLGMTKASGACISDLEAINHVTLFNSNSGDHPGQTPDSEGLEGGEGGAVADQAAQQVVRGEMKSNARHSPPQ